MSDTRTRVAILGGGMAGLASAFELTRTEELRNRFQVTVYQQGWRLGGKCASGRPRADAAPGAGGRIEEHGLHLWLGFYENAFRMIRQTYDELFPGGPPPVGGDIADGAFKTWDRAFRKHSRFGVNELVDGVWVPRLTTLPEDNHSPGDGTPPPSLWGIVLRLIQWATEQTLSGVLAAPAGLAVPKGIAVPVGLAAPAALLAFADRDPLTAVHPSLTEAKHLASLLDVWRLPFKLAGMVTRSLPFILVDMAVVLARGLINDVVIGGASLASLDEDFKSWLARHGATAATASLKTNAYLRALHDFVFAFVDGATDDVDASSSLEAGCALQIILRMLFDYKGAVFWKMQAGMGDVVIAPLYRVLAKRGVRFELFHRVRELVPAGDGLSIDKIEIDLQATPKGGSYDPLSRQEGGLDHWPSTPKLEALEEEAALRAARPDLESFWSPWAPVGARTLARDAQREEDRFDKVILAIPVGALPFICPKLVSASDRWRAMVTNVKTVATMAYQLWLRDEGPTLGFKDPTAVATAFGEPLDTWADMKHLLPMEGSGAGSLFYFCGPLAAGPPDPRNGQTEAAARAAVENAVARLHHDLRGLFPAAVGADGRFADGQIVDAYLRANVSPSERYTLSAAGTGRHRLAADGTGVDNLFIAGDWVATGLNAGCVESAVVSGMRAANAVKGLPLDDGVATAAPF